MDHPPSDTRSVPGSVNIPVAQFPPTPKPSSGTDASAVAAAFVAKLNRALAERDFPAASALFVDGGYWRDHLALTWRFRTVQGPPGVEAFLREAAGSRDGLRLRAAAVDASTEVRAPKVAPLDAAGTTTGVQCFLTLETAVGRGVGFLRLVESGGGDGWKAFTLYTRLEEIRGHEEATGPRRSRGVEHGGKPGRKNWAERRAAAAEFGEGHDPVVLIVGAGQAGLTAAARLKMLGVEALMIDKNDRVGDNWRKRYHQLVLHDPVWYDHMPYLSFPPHWPVFTPKDKLADFFEAYASLLELNVWTRTELVGAEWDEGSRTWSVAVRRGGETRTLRPRHLIQATGHSGKKNQPALAGTEGFAGDLLCHSSEFPGARPGREGKKAVVVGSCNSAHDIAQDYAEKGYAVTMVQRSTTHVVSSAAITDIGLAGVYEEGGPPVDDADVLIHGMPAPVLKANQVAVVRRQAAHDRATLDGLRAAGFRLDSGPDGGGLFMKYFQRGGGYYIDVGASRLIAEGAIAVKQGREIDRVLPRGLRFADGSELEADEIVLATGYLNMRTQTRLMFGDAVADRVADVWGLNNEGEMRTVWQRSGHPGFWFHGGNLALCRYYSRLLALQIKGQEVGLYEDGEV
ncbi:hypothetical protein N3K66_006464 [Trichothecium roseum]|uniref:Uncharacterized protein n=1 Tax=Trichothecium roseum TaxID=47278 RepID=A0ACC0UVU6_9HYPO|nr:hypothetical protein N3K66_006464 [Trichothecium roseum]